MDPWFAKALVLAGNLAIVAIRAPYGHRSRKVAVERSHKSALEVALLALAWIGFFVPLLWIVSPVLAFADYPLRPIPYVAGAVAMVAGLVLFHRSHVDLGDNWSITLEIRAQHTLVTRGVYSRIRHPMYAALLAFCIGQALALPNWVAGPAYLAVFTLLVALRLGPEERMMRERFGDAYAQYAERSRRIVPGVW